MMPMPVSHAGLFVSNAATPVPLRGVEVRGKLVGPAAEITVIQTYTNTEQRPIEAVYVFPLDADAALCGFVATVADRRVEGRIEERERAFEIYDDAMADGDGAFLVDQERPNIFTASVGNLPPGAIATIELRYVTFVADEGDARRFVLPTTVSPRYVADQGPEVGQPDGERINPERQLTTDYGLTLSLELEVPEGLAEVASPTHPIRTRLTPGGAVVELAQEATRLDRDFVLQVSTQMPREPFAAVAAEEDGTRVAMVSFRPDVAALLGDAYAGSEVIFLLDCSGSMQGTSIDQAKRALSLCLRTLDQADCFNIVRFGSHHEMLWPQSRRFDEGSLQEATRYLERSGADLGGTEIMAPLQDIYQMPLDRERPRQVLLLTDGQVSNEAQIIDLARQHQSKARVFTFGIGAGASDHLVKGVARASRGASEFIAPGERIEAKVLRMFNRVRTPALNDARVDFGSLQVEMAPRSLPPIFAGDRLNILARIRSGHAESVALHAGGRTWRLPLNLERPDGGQAIVTLWARERIKELDAGAPARMGSAQSRGRSEARKEKARQELIALSKRYGIVCSATSFVAVDVRSAADKTTEQAELRHVPVNLTDGWGGAGRSGTQWMGGGGAPTMTRAGSLGGAVRARMATGAPPPAPLAAAPAAAPSPAPMMPGGPPRSEAKEGGLAAAASNLFGSIFDRKKRKAKAEVVMEEAEAFSNFGDKTQFIQVASESRKPSVDHVEPDLYDLLLTQRADGAFPWSMDLAACLGDRVSDARRAMKTAADADVVVTAIVLAVLERDFGADEEQWRGAADKARRWLSAQATSFDAAAFLASS